MRNFYDYDSVIRKDLIEAEEIQKKQKEDTEELHKKDLNDPDNQDGIVSHPGLDILECKASGPQEALLPINPLEVLEFQQSYLKS